MRRYRAMSVEGRGQVVSAAAPGGVLQQRPQGKVLPTGRISRRARKMTKTVALRGYMNFVAEFLHSLGPASQPRVEDTPRTLLSAKYARISALPHFHPCTACLFLR
jgi:hypothetical protein